MFTTLFFSLFYFKFSCQVLNLAKIAEQYLLKVKIFAPNSCKTCKKYGKRRFLPAFGVGSKPKRKTKYTTFCYCRHFDVTTQCSSWTVEPTKPSIVLP